MKIFKLLILFVSLFLFSCTSSKEDKAQKMIQEHLKKTLNHPDTYESISFGSLDSAFENLSEDADPNTKYPKIFSGFKMSHDYKAVDIFNKLHAERQMFFFDSALTKIVAVRDTIKQRYLQNTVQNTALKKIDLGFVVKLLIRKVTAQREIKQGKRQNIKRKILLPCPSPPLSKLK